jgi:HupE / UreJ protein
MLSEFLVYLRLGFEHISDLKGLDHIVFIVALAAIYSFDDWKRLLWLVTSFTIGHSVTLVLATLDLVSIDSDLVEVLIPITIVIVAIVDLIEVKAQWKNGSSGQGHTREIVGGSYWRFKYGLALVFGLVHGLGFSNFLRALLGESEQLIVPLLSFNIGLEIGQIMILSGVLAVSYGIIRTIGVPRGIWGTVLSVSCVIVGLGMLFSRI